MSLKVVTGSAKKGVVILGCLVAASGLVAWHRSLSHDLSFANDHSVFRTAIPASLKNVPVEAGPSLKPTLPLKYSLGDRLKVTLFESVDLSDEEQANIPLTGLVERTELTGEYVVHETGNIVMPLLGSIEVDGQSTDEVVTSLQEAFKRSMRRPARASVVLLDREPIYIVGKDVKPSTVKYSPGMTVLHAVALSGSAKTENSEVYIQSEYVRNIERQEISTQKLKKLMAQSVALRAEQDGQALELPARLIELAGMQEAKKLVDTAVEMRRLLVAAREPQVASYQSALAAARQEAASHANRIGLLDEHTKLNVERRDAVRELRSHSNIPASTLVAIENEVATVREKKEEAIASLSRAKDNIAQAEQNLAKLEAELRLELQNQVLKTDAEIAEQEASLKAARRLTNDLRIATLRYAGKGQNVSYEIIRRTRHGTSRNKVTETTELTPGDLIQVTSGEEGSGI
jgi:exopolysaccharide production protein ExoF